MGYLVGSFNMNCLAFFSSFIIVTQVLGFREPEILKEVWTEVEPHYLDDHVFVEKIAEPAPVHQPVHRVVHGKGLGHANYDDEVISNYAGFAGVHGDDVYHGGEVYGHELVHAAPARGVVTAVPKGAYFRPLASAFSLNRAAPSSFVTRKVSPRIHGETVPVVRRVHRPVHVEVPVHGGRAHGGSVHGGSVHGGRAHGGFVHGGFVHGGRAHGGPVHTGRRVHVSGPIHAGRSFHSGRSIVDSGY